MLLENFKIVISALLTLSLAGCFFSEEPLIPEGTGVLPVDGKARICAEGCEETYVSGDGYIIISEENDETAGADVRFTPLFVAGVRQIYLAEVIMDDDPTTGYIYAVARRSPEPVEGAAMIEMVLLNCADLDASEFEGMRQAGWEIEDNSDDVTCKPPSVDALLELIRSDVSADVLGDDAWWAEQRG